jgi:hypothetical protein
MHPQLATIVSDFEKAQARLHRLVQRVPADKWGTRADPDAWSVGECVVHLNLTARAFLPLIRRGLDDARLLGAPAPARYRRDPLGWLISWIAGPTPPLVRRFTRVKTGASFVPAGNAPRDAAVAEFDALQQEQIALTRAGNGLPLSSVKVPSPFDARVRYNLYAALVTLPGHQHRHLEQAEHVWGS